MDFLTEQPMEKLNVKQINRSNIYQTIYEKPGISRQEIASLLRLSLPTVIGNIQDLMQEGLIEENGYVGYTGGRNAKAYGIVERARVAIGLELTKNHITAVAVDLCGQIIFKLRLRYPFAYEDAYFRKLGDVVQQLIEEVGLEPSTVLGVGIGVPGLVTEDGDTVFYGGILNFTGATREKLAKYIEFPTMLFNDAKAAAFAESWQNKNIDNAFYVMLSNNIGGAVFIQNKVFHGDKWKSAEIGHITVVPNGKTCYCGQKGCMDAYCASTVLSDYTGGSLEKFFELLKEKEPRALMLWEEYLQHLSVAVNTVHTLFDCTIILGGHVGGYMEDYLENLRSITAKKEPFEDNADYLIVCQYKTEAIAAGAGLNFISQYLQKI